MSDSKVSALTNYSTPLDADNFYVAKASDSTSKKTTWANIKATLKTYFDTLYQASGSYQPLDSDLTTIAALTATTDSFLQAKASAWASRTIAQVKTDLAISNVDNTSDSTKNSATATVTNKRIQKRVVATTQSATPTINTDNGDVFEIVGLAQAVTSMTTNLSGTPVEGEMIEIIFKDNATARAITWGASFVSSTVTLPTTTVISTPLAVLLQYRTSSVWTDTSAWYCIATA
jgi:hypothetical protein